jgi:hypothetical protein
MSEEQQEGGLSALKKTLIGVVTTAVTGAGVYVTTNINKFFGVEDEEKPATEIVQPAPAAATAPVVINMTNNNTQQQSGGHTVIKETVREVPAQAPAQPAAVVEPKKETTAERIARLKAEKEAREAGK